MIRIAIVSSSNTAAAALRAAVTSLPDYTVAWTVGDGHSAVDKLQVDVPDMVVVDLVLTGMTSVECIKRISAGHKCAIIVVDPSPGSNFELTFQALSSGALEVVPTPKIGADGSLTGSNDLLERLVKVGSRRTRPSLVPAGPSGGGATAPGERVPLVLIGASTGGPRAVADVLSAMKASTHLAVFVVQHVDSHFATGLQRWLERESGFTVRLAKDGDVPEAGVALLAGTNDHLIMNSRGSVHYTPEPVEYPYRPSVDVFFNSVARYWPVPGTAALLTGMGQDGARGLLALKAKRWVTIAQDEKTCVVWGMPRAAAELGAATYVLPISEIGGMLTRKSSPARAP